MGFMIFGSLVCNYIIYFTNGYDKAFKLCKIDPSLFHTVAYFQPMFEILKRLNGVYLLIFVVTGQQFRKIFKDFSENTRKKFMSFEMSSNTTHNTHL
jgi:hypothetical protein